VQNSLFPEASHPIVTALNHCSDQELLTLLQRYPDRGQYFVTLFCRYSSIVHTLVRRSMRSPVQADYLFAITWRHIFNELGGLNLRDGLPAGAPPTSLQNWLINITAACINRVQLPPVESINYSLQATSPPLWCYVERSLDQLPPIQRLMVLMAQTFGWSETRISAYLQAEGERMSPAEVKRSLLAAYQELEASVPDDISQIYLGQLSRRAEQAETQQAIAPYEADYEADDLDKLFDLAAFRLEGRAL
jgi:DNA-directed RNA polymerase specialized sigma24 family protein